jgi:hypothetical protein
MLVWLEAPPGETEQTIWEQRWEDAVMQSAVGSSKGYVRCKPLQGAWIDSDDAVRTAEAALGTPHEAALWLDLDLAGFAGGGFGDDWCQGSPEWVVRWFDAGKLLDGGTTVTEVRLDPASGEARSVRTGRLVLPGDVAWSTHAERTLTPADQATQERWDVDVPDGLAALRPVVERQGVAVPCAVVGVAEFTLHGPDGQEVPWGMVEWPAPGTWSVRWPSGPAGCAGDSELRLALDVVR